MAFIDDDYDEGPGTEIEPIVTRTPKTLVKDIRMRKAAVMKMGGMTDTQISRNLGIAKHTVQQYIQEVVRDAVPQATIEEMRAFEVARIEALIASRWKRAYEEQDDRALDRIDSLIKQKTLLLGLKPIEKKVKAGENADGDSVVNAASRLLDQLDMSGIIDAEVIEDDE